jgi:hypothetical protein
MTVPSRVKLILMIVCALGVVAFVWGLVAGEGQRAWQIYFVNFLFWSGVAQGGVAMAGVYRMTNARWGDQFRRMGESLIAFLPISILLYGILVAGGRSLFPWVGHAFPGKEVWLNEMFVFVRAGGVFLVLFWISTRFVKASRNSAPALSRLTPVLLILFVVLYSLIGFDLVMSLDPYWYSTLFGWLYVLHAFFGGLVAVTILAVVSRTWRRTETIEESQWHDMGRFVFGFCLLSGGFFWSQFLVHWYGNLPEETSFLLKRFYAMPWEPLMWASIIGAYLLPLGVFLSKRVKQVPEALLVICLVIFAALFLERFVAVVPFVWNEPVIPFGVMEALVTAGFGALFMRVWIWQEEKG